MQSTLTLAIFIITNALTLNCNALEPVTETSPAAEAYYNLLDIKGNPTSTNARCATITNSGLTWELKTDDGSIHDKDNVYRWGGIGAENRSHFF
jgi:hypothetical protein